jgi:polyhydroxybutyrate depolymerase
MLVVHGRRDENFPAAGAEPRPGQTARRLSVSDTLAALRSVNGCTRQGQAGRDGSVYYAGCTGAPLAFVGLGRGTNDWFRDGADYRLNKLGVDAARLADNFLFDRPAFALPAGGGAGTARAWFVYAPPSYDSAKPMPVVVLLHGRPSNATSMAFMTRMNDVADKKGFIVVYPEGVNNEWNAFYDLTRQRSLAPQDDIKFLRELLADLSQDLNIDRRRTYVGGYSNGGFMTYRLACSMADTFAGFAAVDAGLYTVLKDKCRGGVATPILIMNGTADPSIPYTGVEVESGDGQKTRVSLSVPETVAWFINRNDCSMVGVTTTFPPRGQSPGTQALRFAAKDCKKAPVIFWRIDGGGHTWPGVGGPTPDSDFGLTNMDINAGEVIWEFFSGLSLAQEPAS